MEGLNIKMAKMAMEADGNIIGDCFIVQPEKDLIKKLGVLFGIVEIYNINDTFIDGFLESINDLKTEYYLPPYNLERGVEKRFEEALSRANRRIQNAVNQSVEEVDLRNVSAVLGVVCDNKIYISSTGHIKGLLSRRKKSLELMIFDILAGSQEKKFKPEAEKIFANILSGELSEKDALIFINEEFLGFFSQNDLSEIALSNPASEAVKFLENSLKEKVAKKNFYSIVISPDAPIVTETPAGVTALKTPESRPKNTIAEITPTKTRPAASQYSVDPELRHKVGQAIAKNVKPQQSIDKLLYTQVKTEKYLTPSLMPNWQKFLIIFAGGAKKASIKIWRQSQKAALGLIGAIKGQIAKRQSAAINPESTIAGQIPLIANPDKLRNPETVISSETPIPKALIEEPRETPVEIATATAEDNETAIITDQETVEIEGIDNQTENPDSIEQNDTETEYSPAGLTKSEELTPKTLEPKTVIMSASAKSIGLTDQLNNWLNGLIVRFLNLNKTQQMAFVGLMILLFIFCQSVVMIGRSYDRASGAGSGYDQIAKKIEEQLNTAEAQNIFNDEAGALAAIKKAKELLDGIPTKRSTNSLKQQLNEKINAVTYNLQRLVYQENPQTLANFNKNNNLWDLAGMARTGKVFWAFDNSERNLLRLDSLTDKLEVRTSSLPAIKKISAIDDKNLILLSQAGEYYKYDINKKTSAKISKPAKEYFKIKNPSYSSPLLDPPLASSTIEMSAEADGYSWFLDGRLGKLMVFDKSGILKRQYASPRFVSSTAFNALMREKKAWVFNQGIVYQLEIDF